MTVIISTIVYKNLKCD